MTGEDSATTPHSPDEAGGSRVGGSFDSVFDASIDDLSRLVMGLGERGLEDLLQHVAEFAVQAIPAADGAGLTLMEADRPDVMVASADFVRQVDAIQYGIGEGPCITAASELRTVRSGSLGEDAMWPRFGPQVALLGVHSALSVPLRRGQTAIGAINIYAHAHDAFDEWAAELGEHYAEPAAISVYHAQALAQARRVATELQSALTKRAVIDQALGILMSRSGASAKDALDRLTADAQANGQPVVVAARSIVDEAIRQARRRRGDGEVTS